MPLVDFYLGVFFPGPGISGGKRDSLAKFFNSAFRFSPRLPVGDFYFGAFFPATSFITGSIFRRKEAAVGQAKFFSGT